MSTSVHLISFFFNWFDSISSPAPDTRTQAAGVFRPHAPTAPPDLVTATYWSVNHHMRWDSIVFEGTINENYLHVLNIPKVGVTNTHQRMLCGVTGTPAEFIPVQTDFNSALEDCHRWILSSKLETLTASPFIKSGVSLT